MIPSGSKICIKLALVVFKERERDRSDKLGSGTKRKEYLVKELESILKQEGKAMTLGLRVVFMNHLMT